MRRGGLYEFDRCQPHFLDSCFRCHKPISQNSDIFMYRGNTPFCSQDCRQEQIEMDESSDKRWKISSAKKSSSARQNAESSNKESHTKKSTIRTGGTELAVA